MSRSTGRNELTRRWLALTAIVAAAVAPGVHGAPAGEAAPAAPAPAAAAPAPTAAAPVPSGGSTGSGPVSPVVAEVAAVDPLYAAPTRTDRSGRIIAAVMINGQGPFRFILDTGANRSALSSQLVQRLQLPPTEEGSLEVHGVTGVARLDAVRVDSMQAGDIRMSALSLPVITGDIFGTADGILGIHGMQRARIEVDFENDRVAIVPTRAAWNSREFMAVPARIIRGGLLQAAGKVGRVDVRVIIDTGAERTLGNLALLSALQQRALIPEAYDTHVIGATSDTARASVTVVVPPITIGEAEVTDLPVTFGDLHAFGIWGLESKPTLLIGMDLIGMLRNFIVDYGRRRVYLRSYTVDKTMLEHCDEAWCASRMPGS